MSPASEQVLGKHPRAYVGNGVFSIVAGAVFGFMGQSLDGAFRLGVVAIGVLVAVFGVWQIAYAWALRRATDRL